MAAPPAHQPPPRPVTLTSRSVQLDWDEPLAPNGVIERWVNNIKSSHCLGKLLGQTAWTTYHNLTVTHSVSFSLFPAVSYISDQLAHSPLSLYPSLVLRDQLKSVSLAKGEATMWQVRSHLCQVLRNNDHNKTTKKCKHSKVRILSSEGSIKNTEHRKSKTSKECVKTWCMSQN